MVAVSRDPDDGSETQQQVAQEDQDGLHNSGPAYLLPNPANSPGNNQHLTFNLPLPPAMKPVTVDSSYSFSQAPSYSQQSRPHFPEVDFLPSHQLTLPPNPPTRIPHNKVPEDDQHASTSDSSLIGHSSDSASSLLLSNHSGSANLGETLSAQLGSVASRMKGEDEKQPLLLGGTEPLNDTYEHNPPNPVIRASPDINVNVEPIEAINPTEVPRTVKYDPAAHRDNGNKPAGEWGTVVNLLKGNIGTGILAMPDAFRNAGLYLGIGGTFLMGIICTHCMIMLVDCAHVLYLREKVPFLSFSQVVETAFRTGPRPLQRLSVRVKWIVDIFLCITQLGFCCVYFLFVATSLQDLMANWFGWDVSMVTYLAMILLPIISLNMTSNLRCVTSISGLAAFLTAVSLTVMIGFYLIPHPPRYANSLPPVAPWERLPLYFGTAIYAFEGIGVVLPIENKMHEPQRLTDRIGILTFVMSIVALLYIGVGFFGYLQFGDKVAGSVTLNLDPSDVGATLIKVVFAVAIGLSYGLQFLVPIETIWPWVSPYFHTTTSKKVGEYVLRIMLIIFTFMCAAVIPNLSLFISLVGAVSSSMLALIFPPIVEIMTCWHDNLGKYYWKLWKDILILTFGLSGFAFGSYTSIKNIIDAYSS